MTFVIMRKTTLQQQIETAVNQAFKAWTQGDGTGDDRGLYGEFDSLHSRIRALQLETKRMQGRIDVFKDILAQVSAKIDELKAKGEGVPVDVFNGLIDDLKAVLAKLA
jgi:hypothetical protein